MKYFQAFGKDGVNADANYILIQKSNYGDFPHPNGLPQKDLSDCKIYIHNIIGQLISPESSEAVLKVGVIKSNVAATGEVVWLAIAKCKNPAGVPTQTLSLEPLIVGLQSSRPVFGFGSGSNSTTYEATNANFGTGDTGDTPYDTGENFAAGDVVIELTVASCSGDFVIGCEYTIEYI